MTGLVHLATGAVVGGDFRLIEQLGRGGMGVVYLAEQLSTGKQRAVKVMLTLPVEGDKQRERFEQEARVGARIASDHVVEVIGAGVDDETGVPWLAMELLEGEDLGELVDRRGAIAPSQVVEIFQQLCHALGAAHEARIVHRDVKPQNVFLSRTRTPQAPTSIKVLDFGIAKVAASGKTTSTALVGSPAWMAPEQTDPKARITPAADVWALGLLAFWLLTGRAYWLSAEAESASVHALLREVLFEPIVPASTRAAELGCAEELPSGFDEWFARCVVREPTDRFADASQAGEAFERLSAGDTEAGHGDGGSAQDLALMSTRAFPGATDLGASTSTDDGDRGVMSTRSFIESADLKVQPSPSDSGAAEPTSPTESTEEAAERARPKPSAHATAVTPTGLGAEHGDEEAEASADQQPVRSDEDRPKRRRYLTPALGIAAVAAAFATGALLFSERDHTRRAASRHEVRATAVSPRVTAAAPPSGPRPRKGPKRPRAPGFADLDLNDFDPDAYMRVAQQAAREQVPGAELVMFSAAGVQGDGHIDASKPEHVVQWLFRSKSGKECVLVLVSHAGITSQRTKGPACIGPNVGMPRCSVAEVISKMMGGGSLRVLTAKAGHVTFAGGGKHPETGVWNAQVGPLARKNILDDCGREQAEPKPTRR